MEGLRGVVKEHSKGKAEIVEALIKDEKDTKKKLNAENVDQYDAVVLSGSFKRRYDAPEVQYVIKTVDDTVANANSIINSFKTSENAEIFSDIGFDRFTEVIKLVEKFKLLKGFFWSLSR